ncbi:hypothetical protein NMT30_000536 [Vibrio cholerae]|nr:hypothetical protein [Vibrio cholerae]
MEISIDKIREVDSQLSAINVKIFEILSDLDGLTPKATRAIHCKELDKINERLKSIREEINNVDRIVGSFIKLYDGPSIMSLLSDQLLVIYAVKNATMVNFGEASKLINDVQTKSSFLFNALIASCAAVFSVIGIVASTI